MFHLIKYCSHSHVHRTSREACSKPQVGASAGRSVFHAWRGCVQSQPAASSCASRTMNDRMATGSPSVCLSRHWAAGVAWPGSGCSPDKTAMSPNSSNGHAPCDAGSIRGSGSASSPLCSLHGFTDIRFACRGRGLARALILIRRGAWVMREESGVMRDACCERLLSLCPLRLGYGGTVLVRVVVVVPDQSEACRFYNINVITACHESQIRNR